MTKGEKGVEGVEDKTTGGMEWVVSEVHLAR